MGLDMISHFIKWLTARAGKIKWILCSDWIPGRTRLALPSPARDSPYWYRARKLTKFVTFRQCRHIHKKKINDPLGFIVLQKQLAFTVSSRNRQVILDSHQSEIFCYTMNPLMFKSREYKFSWPSLFGQDDWILASFFFYFFLDWEFVSVPKNVKKKTRPICSHFDLTLVQ